jgi:YbbR domain-containing protein
MPAEAGLIEITKDQLTIIIIAIFAAIVLWNYYIYKKDKLRNEKDALRPTTNG